MGSEIVNMLTIDVEDYFHVSAFERVTRPEDWDTFESRTERNTDLLLDILAENHCTATFFVLGWIASRYPALVKRIAGAGHEIASHGFSHRRLCYLSRPEFRSEIRESKELLENLSGQPVFGFRAPSYSISPQTSWAFDELYAAGYTYDSSVFPFRHDYYGMTDWSRFPGFAVKGKDGSWRSVDESRVHEPKLWEIPISTVRLASRNYPIAGGGYFRLYPYRLTRSGLKTINDKEHRPFIFYLHPWEMDPGQPRIRGAGVKSRFRHYLNLGKTENRFRRLLTDFRFGPIRDVFPQQCSCRDQVHRAGVFLAARETANENLSNS